MCARNRTTIKNASNRTSPLGERIHTFTNESPEPAEQGSESQPDCPKRSGRQWAVHQHTMGAGTRFFAFRLWLGHYTREGLKGCCRRVNHCRWHNLDEPASASRSETKIECSAEGRQSRVKSRQRRPHRSANEHARLSDGENITGSVKLGLIQFSLGDLNRVTRSGH
jgi:hypothetical protein